MASLHAVEWKLLDHTANGAVGIGDLVSTDAGGMPIYRVVALAEGHAQLANERGSATQAMPLDRFRWVGR